MKKVGKTAIFGVLALVIVCFANIGNVSNALGDPTFSEYKEDLYDSDVQIEVDKVSKDKTLKQNIKALFYPGQNKDGYNMVFNVVKGMTLGVMIIFLVRCGASLIFGSKKTEDLTKMLLNMVYILVGGVFVYGASRVFGDVLGFGTPGDELNCTGGYAKYGIDSFVCVVEETLFQRFLLTLKAFAFFLAIVMIVVTGFRVVAAGEADKGKKLLKGVINVVVALFVIKGIDVVYYIAADNGFATKAADLIVNVAKVFAYGYGIAIVCMIFAAGYLYLTAGGSERFKKATNILVNILLSGLVLFSFLFIIYQIFAEFGEGGEAVDPLAMIVQYLNYV